MEGQSNPLFVPSVMETHIPLTDVSAQPEEDLLQRYTGCCSELDIFRYLTEVFLTKIAWVLTSTVVNV